ncbi:MAG: DUF6961 family protein [Sphingosinicella sp.]|uniref:DUF6961 family protein n=1 Tax=Sphingosinicella sp. TaxID=1917971 RepID=UPI0040379A7C
MTEEEHLWACALEIERQHGERAPVHVAERIGALALAEDWDGVERWKAIARCLDALRRTGSTRGESPETHG